MRTITLLVASHTGAPSPMDAAGTDALQAGMIGRVQIVGMVTTVGAHLERFGDFCSPMHLVCPIRDETLLNLGFTETL